MVSQKDAVRISKAMSYVLRHGAEKMGIEMTSDGFIELIDMVSHEDFKKFHLTLETVVHIVETNEKKRFELKQTSGEGSSFEDYQIRAS